MKTARERPVVAEGELRNAVVSFASLLDSAETLTGTPTVEEVDTADLTITNAAINTTVKVVNGKSVAIGKAVQFTFSGQLQSGGIYRIKVTVNTSAVPSQRLIGYVRFLVTGPEDE